MRDASEIFGVLVPNNDVENIVKCLIKDGYRRFASGTDAILLSNKLFRNIAFRVFSFRNPISGWHAFALHALRQPSTHFVNVMDLHEIEHSGHRAYIAKIERLVATVAELRRQNSHFGELTASQIASLSDICRLNRRNACFWAEQVKENFGDRWPMLPTALNELQEAIGSSAAFDLGSKNIMFRRDGTLVFVDPLLEST